MIYSGDFWGFFVRNVTPQHLVYGKSTPGESPDAYFQFSLTSTAEADHEGDGCLMEHCAERFVQCSPFATSNSNKTPDQQKE